MVANVTEAELDCIRSKRGDDAFEAFLNGPASIASVDTDFPQGCLSPAPQIDLTLALVAGEAGPLTDTEISCGRLQLIKDIEVLPEECLLPETVIALGVAFIAEDAGLPEVAKRCLISAYTDNRQYALHPFSDPTSDPRDIKNVMDKIKFALEFPLCLPDDKTDSIAYIDYRMMTHLFSTSVLFGYPEDHPGASRHPLPSDLRCVTSLTEVERIVAFIAANAVPQSADPSLDADQAFAELTQAYADCDISPLLAPATTLAVTIDANTRVHDVAATLSEAEVACLRSETGSMDFEEFLDQPAMLALLQIPQFLAICVGTDTATGLTLAALAQATGGLANIENCVRGRLAKDYAEGFLPLLGPGYMQCLNLDQTVRILVAGFVAIVGGITASSESCLLDVMSDAFDVADQLRSGNPQDSLAITSLFSMAAVSICLTDGEVRDYYSPKQLPADTLSCRRGLFNSRFTGLYTELGPRMFSRIDLSPEEQDSLDEFDSLLKQCGPGPL